LLPGGVYRASPERQTSNSPSALWIKYKCWTQPCQRANGRQTHLHHGVRHGLILQALHEGWMPKWPASVNASMTAITQKNRGFNAALPSRTMR